MDEVPFFFFLCLRYFYFFFSWDLFFFSYPNGQKVLTALRLANGLHITLHLHSRPRCLFSVYIFVFPSFHFASQRGGRVEQVDNKQSDESVIHGNVVVGFVVVLFDDDDDPLNYSLGDCVLNTNMEGLGGRQGKSFSGSLFCFVFYSCEWLRTHSALPQSPNPREGQTRHNNKKEKRLFSSFFIFLFLCWPELRHLTFDWRWHWTWAITVRWHAVTTKEIAHTHSHKTEHFGDNQ